MLVHPFQCDLCWFRNLKGRDPNVKILSDENLMVFIRRVNFDMLWGTSCGTVRSTATNIRKGIRMSTELGLKPPYLPLGLFPVGDTMGFEVALQMLKSSLLPGNNQAEYQQFDTIRNLRIAYSNLYES